MATRGLGKMRYSEVRLHWLLKLVHMGKMNVERVSGAANIADALTMYHGINKFEALCGPHGIVRR